MSLQLGLRRGIAPLARYSHHYNHGAVLGTASSNIAKRFISKDVGDVIGIDLGTTNSCVAIMVRVVTVFSSSS
jgi:hypothetical protein